MIRIGFAGLAVCLAALNVSCKERSFDGSLKHRTDDRAGIPNREPARTAPAAPQIRDIDLDNADDLKVTNVETSKRSIAQSGPIDERSCKKTREGGPRAGSDYDCAETVSQIVKETTGFEGILLEDWTWKVGRNFGDQLWNLNGCRPSKVTISMNAELLGKLKEGLRMYIEPSKAGWRAVKLTEIEQIGRRNGNFIEADFIVVAKCNEGKVEFKPFFDDGDEHFWPKGPNGLLK
jgi:hypothetical protein